MKLSWLLSVWIVLLLAPAMAEAADSDSALLAPAPVVLSGKSSGSSKESSIVPLATVGGGSSVPRPVSSFPAPVRAQTLGVGAPGEPPIHPLVPVLSRSGGALTNVKTDADRGIGCDLDFGSYMTHLQRRIDRHWLPPKGYESNSVTVTFKIQASGLVTEVHLVHSTGSNLADEAALKAVKSAAPFRPLPIGSPPGVEVQITLDESLRSRSHSPVHEAEALQTESELRHSLAEDHKRLQALEARPRCKGEIAIGVRELQVKIDKKQDALVQILSLQSAHAAQARDQARDQMAVEAQRQADYLDALSNSSDILGRKSIEVGDFGPPSNGLRIYPIMPRLQQLIAPVPIK